MNLRARIYVENQKKDAQAKYAARLAFLQGKGIKPEGIQKDPILRKIKALLRKANFRLASIDAQEKLNRERAQAKLDKLAAEKAAREKPEKEEPKEAPEKKEKKGKKEKQEKPAKPEQKKEKKEKKEERKE